MREKIVYKASEMFLSLGVKSVTMDDLSKKMGISKKTIYEFYANKYELVQATTDFIFENIFSKIDDLCKTRTASPIKSLFEINKFIITQIPKDNISENQLKKYYPEVYQNLFDKKFKSVTQGISENLERGMKAGLYRTDINIPVVARFYYHTSNILNDPKIFPTDDFSVTNLIQNHLIYHIRAIATPKGIKELENYLKQNEL